MAPHHYCNSRSSSFESYRKNRGAIKEECSELPQRHHSRLLTVLAISIKGDNGGGRQRSRLAGKVPGQSFT